MATYLIGARARFVLVEAEGESDARQQGAALLRTRYSEIWQHDSPVEIRTVRPATDDEVRQWNRQHCASFLFNKESRVNETPVP